MLFFEYKMEKKTSNKNNKEEEIKRIFIKDTVNRCGEEVKLAGWVHNRRDHGKIIFIDLRDKSGIVQVVFSPNDEQVYELANSLRNEWVIEIRGLVKKRPSKMVNEKIKTGDVEIEGTGLEVLNGAKTTPFEISSDKEIKEETRLKYRYLDLRRPKIRKNLQLRHRVLQEVRKFLDQNDFCEVETPILTKSTPEGARDFLVPSRLHLGEFYALPQAPQQLKQLLMVAGLERYFQVARCFRDEDLRGDRQPEFTQLDIEMSFVKQEDIINLVEELILKTVKDLVLFDESLSKKLTFNPFKRLNYQEAINDYGTDKPDLREDKNDPNELAFAWVTNWPLFEEGEVKGTFDPCHHIFTAPKEEDIPFLEENPLKARSHQMDLVLNGQEVAGGSIRIHQRNVQEKMFELVGLDKKEINEKFGHILKAFDYGIPPHGGIALGLDRFLMILFNESSIREVIAFPKTGDGKDLTMGAPSKVTEKQLKELGIKIVTQD